MEHRRDTRAQGSGESVSPSLSRQRSRERGKQKQVKWTEQKYDLFLLSDKKGTFKRLDPFKTTSTPTRHQCNNCARIWKPSPKKCLSDDYFCPSCALHHRNNIQRFKDPKFSWTANIPNTFYLYKIVDAQSHSQFYKYGRTQHLKADSRYSLTQRKRYSMSLQYSVRGALKNTTAIQNMWKVLANKEGIKPDFSEKQFHGATQCIMLNPDLLKELVSVSQQISKMDPDSYENYTLLDLKEETRKRILALVQEVKGAIKL